ncbi:methyltransferase family protein [Virgibacillus flavescens]|uniref:methyltransferase family protein n=1 Tax=Virgibacillus flavescens TaxID=1611422 RepID=UPI003D329234
MYGIKKKSWPQKLTIMGSEFLFLLVVVWFLFLDGNHYLQLSDGNVNRNVILFIFCLIVFLRMNGMMIFLLKRGITWGEAGGVIGAFAVYYLGFSFLGGTTDIDLDGIDWIAVALFLTGSLINTGSEVLRHQWKKDSQNKKKLYTGCLFRYAIHINYFGDFVWVSGFALLTRNLWAGLIPVFLGIMFIFLNIPQHDQYLREKYGTAFEAYEKKTKKFFPFIY